MAGLPRFENFRLQAMMRYMRETEAERDALLARVGVLDAQMGRASVRAVQRAADGIARYPTVYSVLRKGGELGWKMARYLVRRKRQLAAKGRDPE